MLHLLTLLATAAVAFTVANIDDLIMLLLFFSDQRIRSWQIISGQYLGIAAVIAICLMGAAAASYLPQVFVRALGIVPMAVGVHKLVVRSKKEDRTNSPRRSSNWGQVLTIAGISLANCSDSIVVFPPFYARSDRFEKGLITLVFLVMVGLWCASARYLTRRGNLRQPIRRLSDAVAPWALIGLGLVIVFW